MSNAEQTQSNHAELKAAALSYYEIGVNVIPISVDKNHYAHGRNG